MTGDQNISRHVHENTKPPLGLLGPGGAMAHDEKQYGVIGVVARCVQRVGEGCGIHADGASDVLKVKGVDLVTSGVLIV